MYFFFKELNVQIIRPAISTILGLVWLFLNCFYGNLITIKLEQVADFAYESVFYKYPNDLRIFTLMTMCRSQRPFFITGYKITQCSLESYKRVSCLFSICKKKEKKIFL